MLGLDCGGVQAQNVWQVRGGSEMPSCSGSKLIWWPFSPPGEGFNWWMGAHLYPGSLYRTGDQPRGAADSGLPWGWPCSCLTRRLGAPFNHLKWCSLVYLCSLFCTGDQPRGAAHSRVSRGWSCSGGLVPGVCGAPAEGVNRAARHCSTGLCAGGSTGLLDSIDRLGLCRTALMG